MKTNVRIKTTKGKKKWRKGDACATNPTVTKHRENAKQTQIYQRKKNPVLTVDAIEAHEDNFDDDDEDNDMAYSEHSKTSGMSRSSKAFSISGLTDCTNMTFNKVTRMWSSQSESSKQICAVLAAVTEIIRARGGVESETEYFAALMTALETTDDKSTKNAITYLLSLVIRKLPPTLLKLKFGEVSKVFLTLLGDNVEDNGTAHLKNILDCFSTVLTVQESLVWHDSSTMKIFHSILTFSTHGKPKIRKACHYSIRQILKLGIANSDQHPALYATAKYCVQSLETSTNDRVATLHTLNLLKLVIQYFGAKEIKIACETILKIISMGNALIKVNCLQVIHCLFDACPTDSSLPSMLNGKIITALYELQPSINDVQVAAAWLKVINSGHCNLSRIDAETCSATLPKLFSTVMAYVLSDFKEVASAATKCLKETVTDSLLPMSAYLIADARKNEKENVFTKIFGQVEVGLKYRYQTVWHLACQLLAVFYKEFGGSFGSTMMKSVVSMCELHQIPNLIAKNDVEKAVGAAVRYFGPKSILEAYPLNLLTQTNKCEFPRAWLLPLLKEYVQSTELQHFIDFFLPCAAKLRQKAHECKENGLLLEGKVYDTLQHQIWSLLPGYCTTPTDLTTSFKNIARFLGTALNEREELRPMVLTAMRTLINKNNDNDENTVELAKFSKNYLPILFNLLTNQSQSGINVDLSLAVIETIKSYLTITDKKLIENLLEKVVGKIQAADETTANRHSLLDLVVVMVPYASTKLTTTIFSIVIPLTKSADVTSQKKSYRILEEICASRYEGCLTFLDKHFTEIQQCLLDSLSSSIASSKAPRLRCLTSIVGKLKPEQRNFVTTILPEVILCTKEINSKARSAAFNLLVEVSRAYIYLSGLPKEECVTGFFELVMAGLAGSSHMISASLLAFTKLAFEYKDSMAPRLVQTLLKTVTGLMKSKYKEVRKSSMIFVKALVVTLDVEELRQHAHSLVSNLFHSKDGKTSHRHQSKVVVERLTRKLGYEFVRDLVPEAHRRFVVNLHKTTERNKRRKENEDDSIGTGQQEASFDDILRDSDSEDEADADNAARAKMKGKKGKKEKPTISKSWIVEAQEDAVDFLDPKASMRIVGTQPKLKDGKRKADSFERSEDGRFVIDDPDDIDGSQSKQGFKNLAGDDDEEDDATMETDSTNTSLPRYKPGGRGIHRSLGGDEDVRPGGEYRSKKARGDVSLRGKHDPFTYIPLNRQKLNRRKTAKLAGQFDGIVKATKRGSLKAKRGRRK